MDSDLLNKILGICAPILTALFVPFVFALVKYYLKQADQAIQGKVGAQWEMAKSIVVEAVKYAEQSGLAKAGIDMGREKLRLSVVFVENALEMRGVKLDLFPIKEMIEAAVMEEFNKDKLMLSLMPLQSFTPEKSAVV